MDKKGPKDEKQPGKWAWLPAQMPGVARLMAEKRRELGNAHVNECWERGVLKLEPCWFYAREGPLAVGTPWAEPGQAPRDDIPQFSATQAVLMLREVAHGPR